MYFSQAMKNILKVLLLISLLLSLVSCNEDGNISDPDRRTYLRFLNAVTDVESVDLLIESDTQYSDIRYLESTGYFRTSVRNDNVTVTVSDTFTPLYNSGLGLSDSADQSFIVYGTSAEPRALVLRDDNSRPGEDVSKIRVVNVSNASGNVDVYILENRNLFSTAAPSNDTTGFGSVSRYFASNKGSYEITVTRRDSKEILARVSNQDFQGDAVYTVLIADSQFGRLPPKIIVLKDK